MLKNLEHSYHDWPHCVPAAFLQMVASLRMKYVIAGKNKNVKIFKTKLW